MTRMLTALVASTGLVLANLAGAAFTAAPAAAQYGGYYTPPPVYTPPPPTYYTPPPPVYTPPPPVYTPPQTYYTPPPTYVPPGPYRVAAPAGCYGADTTYPPAGYPVGCYPTQQWVAYCQSQFKSFNVANGYYLGFDRAYHFCN
ncbi:MAG: BA14K family protein [Bauldia sp.]